MAIGKLLQDFYRAWQEGGLDGDHLRKEAFHRLARQVARQIAKDLELTPSTFQTRTSMGGPGVGGDTYLQAESLHLCFCTFWRGPTLPPVLGMESTPLEVLYRRAKADRSEGMDCPNNWTTYEAVTQQYPEFLAKLRAVMTAP